MARKGYGRMVLVGSTADRRAGRWNRAAYCGGKAALAAMARSFSVHWGQAGITTNVLAPGMLATEAMADEVVSEWVKENTIARHPPRRWGKPEEVVTALLYLVSPASAYVTGSEVVADGSLSGAW